MRNSSTLENLNNVDQKNCSKFKNANKTSRSFMKGAAVNTMEKPANPSLIDCKRLEPNKTLIIDHKQFVNT